MGRSEIDWVDMHQTPGTVHATRISHRFRVLSKMISTHLSKQAQKTNKFNNTKMNVSI